MRNLILHDYFAGRRASGAKTVTRRLTCQVKPGDVVYHGECLELHEEAFDRIARYRRDLMPVLETSRPEADAVTGTGRAWCEWRWQRNVLPGRFCPTSCARLFSLIRDVRQEPLTALTEDDAIREGLELHDGAWMGPGEDPAFYAYARVAFQAWWWSLHGADSWSGDVYRIDLGAPLSRKAAEQFASIADPAKRLAIAAEWEAA